jgi:hypothetical protein
MKSILARSLTSIFHNHSMPSITKLMSFEVFTSWVFCVDVISSTPWFPPQPRGVELGWI